MNYKKIYDNIINRAQHRKEILEYSERHHIIPTCQNGEQNLQNIVILTAREHFIAHWLLIKIYPKERKLICAFNRLTSGNYNNGQRYISKSYKYAREKFSKYMKDTCCVIDKDNNIFRTLRNDIRIKSQEVLKYSKKGIPSNRVLIIKDDDIKSIKKELLDSYLEIGWKKHISKKFLNCGKDKVYVNNKIKHLFIKKEELQKYLNEGWIRGKLFCSNKNTIWITNNIENKMIYKKDLEYFFSLGWKKGCSKTKKESKVHITDGIKDRRIPKSELEEYVKKGYHEGRTAKPCKDRTWISDINNIRKAVILSELSTYLNNGWKLGYKKV